MAPSQSTGDCFRRSIKFCAIFLRIQEASRSLHLTIELPQVVFLFTGMSLLVAFNKVFVSDLTFNKVLRHLLENTGSLEVSASNDRATPSGFPLYGDESSGCIQ